MSRGSGQARPARNPQRDARNRHTGDPRQERDLVVVPDVDRELEGQHADEVHRPDAGSHRQRAARPPAQGDRAIGGAHALGQIERHVGRHRGNEHGQDDDPRLVTRGEKAELVWLHRRLAASRVRVRPPAVFGKSPMLLDSAWITRGAMRDVGVRVCRTTGMRWTELAPRFAYGGCASDRRSRPSGRRTLHGSKMRTVQRSQIALSSRAYSALMTSSPSA